MASSSNTVLSAARERLAFFGRTANALRERIQRGLGRGPDREPEDRGSAAGHEAPHLPVSRVTAAPEGVCIYAVGDIHGRRDLLDQLLVLIEEDAAKLPEGIRPQIVFLGDDATATATRNVLRGGWLELYVHSVVRRHKGSGVQDSVSNVRISDARESINEIDVAFLTQNQLTLVECKTTKSQSKSENAGGGTPNAAPRPNSTPFLQAAYKLGALKQALRSITTRMVLVSLQPLTSALTTRATAWSDIQVVNGPLAIQDFESSLQQWIRPARR
jgi:hypothetical protein